MVPMSYRDSLKDNNNNASGQCFPPNPDRMRIGSGMFIGPGTILQRLPNGMSRFTMENNTHIWYTYIKI